MDIRPDEPQRGVKLYPLKSKIVIAISVVFSVAFLALTNVQIGFIGFSSVLCAVGITTVESWNREIREDGYAPLTQLYTSYLTVVFLIVSILPTLLTNFGFAIGLPLSIGTVVVYGGLLQYIAYRGVDECERAIESYDSPSMVYLPDGPFLDHIEEIAIKNLEEENMKEEDSKEKDLQEEAEE